VSQRGGLEIRTFTNVDPGGSKSGTQVQRTERIAFVMKKCDSWVGGGEKNWDLFQRWGDKGVCNQVIVPYRKQTKKKNAVGSNPRGGGGRIEGYVTRGFK